MAELPAGLILIFLGIGLPLILGCAMSYKIFLVYYAVRDAAIHGAKCGTWSDKTNVVTGQVTLGLPNEVDAVMLKDLSAFKWAVVASPIYKSSDSTKIVWRQPLSGGAGAPIANTSLNNADETQFNYSLQVTWTGQIAPFLFYGFNGTGTGGGAWGVNIPGFNAPMPMTVRYQCYCENPKGLAN